MNGSIDFSTYHTYTIEWTDQYISWSVDGTVVRNFDNATVLAMFGPHY